MNPRIKTNKLLAYVLKAIAIIITVLVTKIKIFATKIVAV